MNQNQLKKIVGNQMPDAKRGGHNPDFKYKLPLASTYIKITWGENELMIKK